MMPPRIAVDRSEIETVVKRFYARVRKDGVLGPIFAEHISDWPEHEEKITRFWASALLHEQSYDGNPMMAHIAAGNVRSHHFENWLALFDETLMECVPPDQGLQWSHLVHRIGRGLSIGVQDFHRPADATPSFS